MVKKRQSVESNLNSSAQQVLTEPAHVSNTSTPTPSNDQYFEEVKDEIGPLFKNSNYQHCANNQGKKKTWRSLKQIIVLERSLPWPPEVLHYSQISAPPSFKPAKKYSDISGLPAKYTDPQTKLMYANADEFPTVRSLPSDIISGYLSLRGAYNPIQ